MAPDSLFDDRGLATVRRAYAVQMLALAGIGDDPALEDAFATVPREAFLGPPPWQIARPGGYVPLPKADPALAYQDVLFALAPGRGVNNGSPSLHALWLHRAGCAPGSRVVHLGAGTGYYTALIAHLVGATGQVTAVECDGSLADRARANLSHLPNVTVIEGDGARWPQDEADCIYVNFSVERPAPAWLDRLGIGGRLVFPLGIPAPQRGSGGRHALHGAGLCVRRQGEGAFSVRWLGGAIFVCAEGGTGDLIGSDAEREALKNAFERGGIEFVRSLRWRQRPDPTRSWFTGSGWSLSYDEVE
ncbi:protein-L-isoaspartate O-methyltransferase family protein [Methylorubrum zatmanii]|uniref:Protein-L-isoaspartate O-methyltransferase n=1 Tax=Methylorubrum zatmanii TaxID=29429 RepID=A0ABW1WN79_9HYPH|nr:methyltransferase domain-containing protein [Methylorubrum zatmanii]MBD8909607.1 protein-L-isoaspartate O-methyltransferase [Methylorubrum zatmanii]